MDKFNLSERRNAIYREYLANAGLVSIKQIFEAIEQQDKEFIRLLKEELCGFDKVGELACKEVFEIIDKLAGGKLI